MRAFGYRKASRIDQGGSEMTIAKLWLGLLAGVAVTAVTVVPAAAQTKWDLYAFTGVTHPITLRYKMFADEVKKATDGKLEILVRPAGELPFKATELVKATSSGQVQLAAAYQGFVSGEVPIASLASLPFLVRNAAELEKVWPIIEKYTAPAFAKRGVKILYWHTWPEQNIFGKGKPIQTIADFAGRKIRSTDGKQAEMLKQLGAASVSLTTAEVPVAMERGVAEGFLTAAFNVMGAKWYEFTEWAWMGDVHIGGPDYLIMNTAAYEKLPADVKAKLDATAKDFAPRMRAMNIGDEKGAIEALRTKHNVAIHVPPKEVIDELTAKMKPYWESWAKQHGPDTEALLKEVRAALGK
jgi:TRAP-type C4-dicarboxylate transport system substrate-binding protein